MNVTVRFAPSPTGFIHIGGMRVALINWLFAKQNNGKFILRIEDTDRDRYKEEFITSIDNAISWLGLSPDQRLVQSDHIDQYSEIAHSLVRLKKAYYCYCSQEEIQREREQAVQQKQTYKYNGKCRNNYTLDSRQSSYVIRIDSGRYNTMRFKDMFYGTINANTDNISDAVIVRSNGMPTFVFAGAVDDSRLGITHIIRGNDHITNTFQQIILLEAMSKPLPKFGHVPLLLDMEGHKLSKRHGAADFNRYIREGFLPGAIKNYLSYLGGLLDDTELVYSDKELFSTFNISKLNLSPAKFDLAKMRYFNSAHIKNTKNMPEIFARYAQSCGHKLNNTQLERINKGFHGLQERSDTMLDMIHNARCYLTDEVIIDDEAKELLNNHKDLLQILRDILANLDTWDDAREAIEQYIKESNIKKSIVLGVLRASVVGQMQSPPIYEILRALGKNESLRRLQSTSIN